MAPKHYVDNKKFFDTLTAYKVAVAASPDDIPHIPEYIGECLLMIATRLANKPNFASYTYRDEMISDAVENCLLYMHNFDPAKSQNPFAYFTQIIHFAFLRRIEREKKHTYIKYKYALHRAHLKEDHTSAVDGPTTIQDSAWTSYENIHEFIRAYEDKLNKVPRPSQAIRHHLDDDDTTFDFLEDDEPDTYVDGVAVETEDEEG